jgi:hypothetical protein
LAAITLILGEIMKVVVTLNQRNICLMMEMKLHEELIVGSSSSSSLQKMTLNGRNDNGKTDVRLYDLLNVLH